MNADFTMWKIKSLSSNKKVIPLRRSHADYERERIFEEDQDAE